MPKKIPFKDCVYNIGRAALLISAFSNGKYSLLREATKDRIHEQYRSRLIENFDEIYNKVIELGAFACFLSGAGPTLMSIVDKNDLSFVKKFQSLLKKIILIGISKN